MRTFLMLLVPILLGFGAPVLAGEVCRDVCTTSVMSRAEVRGENFTPRFAEERMCHRESACFRPTRKEALTS